VSEAPEGEVGSSERREAGTPASTSPTKRDVPITFAHRGARLEEPENTIPAFRRALEAGASGLETDVWCSADGEVVCSHDPVVRRGRRRVKIATATATDLAELGVPRLADVYEQLGVAFECSVDVKVADAAGALVEVARRHDALERLWVCSPDVEVLRPLRVEPAVKLVHSDRRRAIPVPLERHAYELASLGIDAMNMHHSEWSAGLVSLFHRFDVRAFAWDTQEVRHLRAMLRIGVDAVYCDRPERMVETVNAWTGEAGRGS
jgi:glycerophosphoryl diester phosphodiesterase